MKIEEFLHIIAYMKGLTAREIGETLGIPQKTVKTRLKAANILPVSYAGMCAIYNENVVEIIKESRGRGRPKKQ